MLILHKAGPVKRTEEEEEAYKIKYDDYEWRLRASKRDIIRRSFIAQADTTYVTARFHFLSQMYFEYYWSSVHSIEKYLKAILLLNGSSAKGIGHNISDAYNDVENLLGKEIFPDRFPGELVEKIKKQIFYAGQQSLHSDGPRHYISRLQNAGGANSRYGLNCIHVLMSDLYCFDLTVFMIRRAAIDFSIEADRNKYFANTGVCHSLYSSLEDIYIKKSPAKKWAEKVNFFLRPDPDFSKALSGGVGLAFNNSAIYNNLVENAESKDTFEVNLSKDLLNWYIENIPLNKASVKELKKLHND